MAERTHYQTLGVPETASVEEIKKQYRAMARKYHPDVNAGPEAAQQFSAIAEAYRILSDTESRRLYDADRALRTRVNGGAPRASSSSTPPPAGARPSTSTAAQEAERLVQLAQSDFGRGRLIEARSRAEQALRYNRKNAMAWELLGDICRAQNRVDDAMQNYTMAIQIDPRNPALHQKIERLARQPSSGSSPSGGYTPHPPTRSSSARGSSYTAPRSGMASQHTSDKGPLLQILVGFFGYFGAFLIMLFVGINAGEITPKTPVLPIVTTWSWPFVASLSAAGALLGATMTITGTVRRIEDDLLLTSSGSGHTTPLGIFVLALGSIFYWAAAAIHLLVSLTQEALTPSLLRLYGVVTLATVLFATIWNNETGGFMQTILFGGNVIFVSLVIGWLLGDFFRPD